MKQLLEFHGLLEPSFRFAIEQDFGIGLRRPMQYPELSARLGRTAGKQQNAGQFGIGRRQQFLSDVRRPQTTMAASMCRRKCCRRKEES